MTDNSLLLFGLATNWARSLTQRPSFCMLVGIIELKVLAYSTKKETVRWNLN